MAVSSWLDAQDSARWQFVQLVQNRIQGHARAPNYRVGPIGGPATRLELSAVS